MQMKGTGHGGSHSGLHCGQSCRANMVHSVVISGLMCYAGYVEGGYRTDRLSAYLRQGFFQADNWDDRIYIYERDVPGSFTVPALYGRGLWTSAMVSYKAFRSLKLAARCSYTAYYKQFKPGKAELKLYVVWKF